MILSLTSPCRNELERVMQLYYAVGITLIECLLPTVSSRAFTIAGPRPCLERPAREDISAVTRPARSTAGPGKPFSRCPITTSKTSFRRRWDRDAEGVEREETDLMHICGQKEAMWNAFFQYFWAMAGPPNVAGPGETSHAPTPPRRAWQSLTIFCQHLKTWLFRHWKRH